MEPLITANTYFIVAIAITIILYGIIVYTRDSSQDLEDSLGDFLICIGVGAVWPVLAFFITIALALYIPFKILEEIFKQIFKLWK